MDLAKALALLKGGPAGIKEWNPYRRGGGECPDLQDVDLAGAQLAGANLSGLELTGTIFRQANLRNADLSRAELENPDFSRWEDPDSFERAYGQLAEALTKSWAVAKAKPRDRAPGRYRSRSRRCSEVRPRNLEV